MQSIGLVLLVALCGFSGVVARAEQPVFKNPKADLELRVRDALSRLTLEEKISLLAGDETGFATKAIDRLSIPSIKMTDGPVGVRHGEATAFPAAIAFAATFDPSLIGMAAQVMAVETRALGRDMLLGPCVNLSRHPFGGRNFESFGEDPYLSTRIGLGYLRGLQGQHVVPSLKHFALNEQEHKRTEINVIADERTMHELHFPMFKALVAEGVWSVMASYNKVNGLYASENPYLLTEILKKQWGFKGLVISDWGATHSTVAAAEAGLDLEMPSAQYFGAPLLEAVRNRALSEQLIDDKASRVLRAIFGSGLFDMQNEPRPALSIVGSSAHLAVAERVAGESLVLLKNEQGLLPLDKSTVRKVAVIGAGAKFARVGGGGSSMVNATRVISPLGALRERAPGIEWNFALGAPMQNDFDAIEPSAWMQSSDSKEPGLRAEYFNNRELSGEPTFKRIDQTINFDWGWNSPGLGVGLNGFSARWQGVLKSATTETGFSVRGDDGIRLWIDGALVLDQWKNEGDHTFTVPHKIEAGRSYQVRMEYFQNWDNSIVGLGFDRAPKDELAVAEKLAAESDVAILFLGLSRHYEGEGVDRATMELPEGQDELVRRVRAANPRTIVVLNTGNPVAMPWLQDVSSLLLAWYAGQEGGYAIADALLGTVNPSGRLPVSFPKRWEDAAAFGHYPEDKSNPDQVTYGEGIYLGYRHFDRAGAPEPLFPFGFGLSYSKFSYNGAKARVLEANPSDPKVALAVTVTNNSAVSGEEVVQVYVSEKNPKIDRPVQELKAFRKIFLKAGESKRVVFTLAKTAFAFYDVTTHSWTVSPGSFELRIGPHSRSLPVKTNIVLGSRK